MLVGQNGPVATATQEADIGASFEPRNSRPKWEYSEGCLRLFFGPGLYSGQTYISSLYHRIVHPGRMR